MHQPATPPLLLPAGRPAARRTAFSLGDALSANNLQQIARGAVIRTMARRATKKATKRIESPQHWRANLPAPVRLTRGRELTTLFDAGRFLAENLKETQQGEALGGTIRALMNAATTGRAADIDYAVLMLRLLLDAERLTRGAPDDPDRDRTFHFTWQSWKGRGR